MDIFSKNMLTIFLDNISSPFRNELEKAYKRAKKVKSDL